MPDIYNRSYAFISYSRVDKVFARQLYDRFKSVDKEVWIDFEDIKPSANWWEEIKAGIVAADVFVFVISPDSLISDICRQEIEHAVINKKHIVPVLYRELDDHETVSEEVVKAKMHPIISSHNWVFFSKDSDFDQSFTTLIEAIEVDFPHTQLHTRLLVQAEEWNDKGWREDLDLKGEELDEAIQWLHDAKAKEKQPEPTKLHELYIDVSQDHHKAQQWRSRAIASSIVIFAVLSALLLFAFVDANEQRNIAKAAADENQKVANSISLVSKAQSLSDNGDSFPALPFALAAYDERELPIVRTALSEMAYNPGAQLWLLEHNARLAQVTTSPTELIAASASYDNTLIIWDMQTGEKLQDPQIEGTHRVRAIDFSPDSETLASCGSDGRVFLWDVATGEHITTLIESIQSCSALAFSPDGQWLVTSFENIPNKLYEIYVWNVNTHELVQITGGTGATVYSVSFTPDNQQFLIGLDTGKIIFWDLQPDVDAYRYTRDVLFSGLLEEIAVANNNLPILMQAPKRILQQQTRAISDLDFDEQGQRLLSASHEWAQGIVIWNWRTGNVLQVLNAHTDTVAAAEFIPGTNKILSAGNDRNIIIWDLDKGVPDRIMTGHQSLPTAAAVSYDGSRAITGSYTGVGLIWDLSLLLTNIAIPNSRSDIPRVVYHPTEPLAASASLDGTLLLWNMENLTVRQTFPDHTQIPRDIDFALNNTALITANTDNLLHLWDIESGTEIYPDTLMEGHTDTIYDIDVNPDGTRALSASQDGNIYLWDLTTKQPIKAFEGLNDGTRILAVAFHSTDNNFAFASSDRVLFMFDLTTGEVVRGYYGHNESIVNLDVSPSGTFLVASDFQRLVVVWDIESAQQLQAFIGHRNPVWSVTIDNSERYVASAAADGEVIVWDLQAGAMIRRFSRYSVVPRKISFSPDTKYLLIGGEKLRHIRLFLTEEITLADWIRENRIQKHYTCVEQGDLVFVDTCTENRDVKQAQLGLNRGSVYMDARNIWEFEGKANDVINIQLQADKPGDGFTGTERRRALELLDTVVSLVDPTGKTIADNDDVIRGQTDSYLTDVTLPADGTYQIIVRSYSDETFGDYNLCFDVSSAQTPATCLANLP